MQPMQNNRYRQTTGGTHNLWLHIALTREKKVREADTCPEPEHQKSRGAGVRTTKQTATTMTGGDAGRRCQHIRTRACDFTSHERTLRTSITRKSFITKYDTHSHLPFGFATCQFLRKLDPVKLTVKVVVNRAFQTSPCLSFPFCCALSPLKQFVEWVSERKLHLGKLPNFVIAAPALLLLWNQCVYGCCPFASARDAQDGGLRVPDMQHAQ